MLKSDLVLFYFFPWELIRLILQSKGKIGENRNTLRDTDGYKES